jgi:membrane associated rhomboid family serine protease
MKPFTPPAALVTRVVIAVCVAVQLAMFIGGTAFAQNIIWRAGLIPARLTGHAPALPGSVPAWLTPLTSMFIHGGWMHLLLNLVFFAWIGRYVEWVTGRWRFVVLYLLGGVAGGLLQVAVSPGSMAPVVGASGAISAVFGTYAVVFARSRASARTILGVSVSSDALTALWYASVWIGLQLLIGFIFSTGDFRIAIWTHIGGFVTGLLFAQPFVRGPKLDI